MFHGDEPTLTDEQIHTHIVSTTLGLRPFWKHHDIVEIPTYYGDHLDLITGATGFSVAGIGLERPRLKVFDFQPNSMGP
jgi:hypothetical protein